jgi:acyl carrier protein
MVDLALRNQVIQRLLAASDAKTTVAEVSDATSLQQDLNLSSLVLITLATELEDELAINIDDEQLTRIRTVGDLFEVIDSSQRRNRRA